MTQNVDLQVKVKFVVDPKDLQAALSGGGSGGAGGSHGGTGGSAPGGVPLGGSGAPRSSRRRNGAEASPEELHAKYFREARQGMNLYVPAMQAYQREYQRQLNNLPFSATALKKSMFQMKLVTEQLSRANPEVQKLFAEFTAGFAETTLKDAQAGVARGLERAQAKAARAAKTSTGPQGAAMDPLAALHAKRLLQLQQSVGQMVPLLKAEALANERMAQGLSVSRVDLSSAQRRSAIIRNRIAKLGPEFQQQFDEQLKPFVEAAVADAKDAVSKVLSKSVKGAVTSAATKQIKPKVGKGYGSEGMFATGTSPIMQGLAWQSLFATGDILGPMSFAPMALYQNYSLKRQRRNRGFDLGAGSDLAKAAGVGDTGQIATAGHALAALRNNAALTPEEREKRMAQVDIMSAGRVRGRLGRNIEMFESGQLGGKGMRAFGAKVGELGGVSSVALGAAAGLGAIAIAGYNVEKFLAGFAVQLQEATESARAASRSARLGLQEKAAGDMPAGARKAALEKYGMLSTPERFQGSALKLLQRGMSKDQVSGLIAKAEAAEASGIGVSADAILAAATEGGRNLSKTSAEQQYSFAGRMLVAKGDMSRFMRKDFAAAGGAGAPAAGSVGDALRFAQNTDRRGAEVAGGRYASELRRGALRNLQEIIAPGSKAIADAVEASKAKMRVLAAEMEATNGFVMFMQDMGILLGGEGSAASKMVREFSTQIGLLSMPLGDRQ